VAIGNETYNLNLTNKNYKYKNYTRNLVGRSFGRCLHSRLLSGSSKMFAARSFGCSQMIFYVELIPNFLKRVHRVIFWLELLRS
jgi:hypothetical protein